MESVANTDKCDPEIPSGTGEVRDGAVSAWRTVQSARWKSKVLSGKAKVREGTARMRCGTHKTLYAGVG